MTASVVLAILVTSIATFSSRFLGVITSEKIKENSKIFRWFNCLAYSTLAALIARIIIFPSGFLSEVDYSKKVNLVNNKIDQYKKNRQEKINLVTKKKIDATQKFLKELNPILLDYSKENGISIIARVNARIPSNNSDIIIVSLQAAKLLDFYKEKVTKVKVEILEDESKKLMNVSKSIINYSSNEIIDAAPTIDVKIENID